MVIQTVDAMVMVEERDGVDIISTYKRQSDDGTWRLTELAGKERITLKCLAYAAGWVLVLFT